MAADELLSSDEDVAPRAPRRPTRNVKAKTYYELHSSDSDDEKIVFKKVKKQDEQDETFLGEISLLTSDEDYEPTTPPPENKISKKTGHKQKSRSKKNIKTVDIVTSDEDTEELPKPKAKPLKPKAQQKKRKVNEFEENESTVTTPAKQPKITPSKSNISPKSKKSPALKKQTMKRTISKSPSERQLNKKACIIESPDVSLNISVDDVNPVWKESELLAERTLIDEEIAQNLIRLWEEGNTIPFIARYRKNVIGDMSPEELRITKEQYDDISNLKKKMVTVAKAVAQVGKLTEKLQGNICAAKTIEELEHIYAPLKSDAKRGLAERAKECGLEEPALHILNNSNIVNPSDYVDPNVKEIKTVQDVEKGIMHILASEMATDTELLKFLRELRNKTNFRIQTKKAKKIKSKEKSPKSKVSKTKPHSKKDPEKEELKFENYFDYNTRLDYLKSHQILAINRGESLKILSVKIEIPDWFFHQFQNYCTKKWTYKSRDDKRQQIINSAIEDAYHRLICPLVTRELRAELKLKAEKESCKVFSDNLKHLLMTRPMKGKAILGVDPGYSNGCKLAIISHTGSLLDHGVVFPHTNKNGHHINRGEYVIKDMLTKYRCNLIAIGNGTACRETEEWICDLIKNHYFGSLDVQYTIVSEDGASIYSCSPEARKEFASLDPNIISAVSLARRIQDPMAELVKVEPCHLGIGMYQLDIKKKQLEEALNEVVSECVSFVGVDLNTASQCLLRRIAGLSDKKATQIIDHRERNGPFTHRRQLVNVYGIGEKAFEQCAGFLRVGPTDPSDINFYKKPSTTPLDATIIHPESYPVVRSLLGKMDLKEKNIGSESFIRDFKIRSKEFNIENLAQTFKTDKPTIQLIFDALSKTLNHDLRTEISKTPLFKKDFTKMENLEVGAFLTGRVKNVTSFGAFVDVGVERDGLVHTNFMKGMLLHLGDVLEVKVRSVNVVKGHIQLEPVRKIS